MGADVCFFFAQPRRVFRYMTLLTTSEDVTSEKSWYTIEENFYNDITFFR